MIKIKINSARFAEAASLLDYLSVIGQDETTATQNALRLLPRFIVDEQDEYIVKIIFDEDGDIKDMENVEQAFSKLSAITPKRLEKLTHEFAEAAKGLVNPQNGKA